MTGYQSGTGYQGSDGGYLSDSGYVSSDGGYVSGDGSGYESSSGIFLPNVLPA